MGSLMIGQEHIKKNGRLASTKGDTAVGKQRPKANRTSTAENRWIVPVCSLSVTILLPFILQLLPSPAFPHINNPKVPSRSTSPFHIYPDR